MISLMSNESFIMKNQSHITFKLERLQVQNSKNGIINWRLIYPPQSSIANISGRIEFEDGEIQKVVKILISNSNLGKPSRIEFFDTTNTHELGMIKISHVCKFFMCTMLHKFSKCEVKVLYTRIYLPLNFG